jgi:thioredoxin reductase
MTVSDIDEIVGAFASAARRVVAAGLDMIHLHGAHGYLLGAFLSPFSNHRTDGYGGTPEKRARFPIEVLAATRAVVGPNFPIGYRISAEEYIEGGLTVEDTARFAVLLANAGIDLIDVSGGIYETFDAIIQGPEAPKGGFVRNAATIKRAVGDRVPVSVGQRLNDPAFANEVLRREGLDFVTLSRAFHADPEYVKKLEAGHAEDIVPCMACHQCTNMLEANVPTRCAANPSTGLERARRIKPAAKSRRVLVVGGGPAGMHTARILALQGHTVSLYDQAEELGGQMRYSSRVAPDYGYLVAYLAGQMRKLRVDVRLGTTAAVSTVTAEAPDAVVVATGALGGLLFFPVAGQAPTIDIFTAFERSESEWQGQKVVIAGGDSESCFLALHLARHGAEVEIVEPKSEFSDNKPTPARSLLMNAVNAQPKIRLRPETTVEEAGVGYVMLQSRGRQERLDGVQTLVTGGRIANNALYEELMAAGRSDVYRIGDAVVPRDVYSATHEAADVAEHIWLQANQMVRSAVG